MAIAFVEPRSFDEAADRRALLGPNAEIVAGGTAVRLRMERGEAPPAALISLAKIAGHDFIRREADGLHLGALSRLRAIERSEVVHAFCPALARAVGWVGSVRIRNQAMLAGGLAAPDIAVDPPTMLLALDAEVHAADDHRTILLSAFLQHAAPRPLIDEVRVPALPKTARATYLKLTPRSAEARPCVTVAAVADFDESGRCRSLRLAVGGAVAVPARWPAADALAAGQVLSDELIADIAAAYANNLVPSGASSEPAWYRTDMIRVFVRRALVEVDRGAG
ncbi:Carbon monoxide dehydrogenase medium chain [Minicystis rosea]|nr:Carbon monoxide dehydrogenase medium chain [Minicystis rosea]